MNNRIRSSSTRFGLILSVACAIHCMVMPLIILVFPFLNESVLHNPFMEWTVLALLVVMGIFSLNHYRKEHHNNSWPTILFGTGVTLFLTALIFEPVFHHLMTIAGSLIIAVSHGVNLALKRVTA